MPLKHAAIFFLNRKFSKIGNYDPGALLESIGSSTTLIELAGSLGLAEEAKLDQEQVTELLQHSNYVNIQARSLLAGVHTTW